MNLCTLLPDLPPADGAERVFFTSTRRSDWCHDHDMDDLHEVFQADGIPYTVQHRPAAPKPESFNDPDFGHDLLTPWARNSSLR